MFNTVERGQKKHGRLIVSRPEGFQNPPTIDVRQHHIQNNEIEIFGHCQVMPIQTIARERSHKTCLIQALRQIIPGFGFVFYYQYAHGSASNFE